MEKVRALFTFSHFIPILFLILPVSFAQLSPSEVRILFRVQEILEFPPVLQSWSKSTMFCNLPASPSLTIICSENHLTELTLVGNKISSLSESFSSDSFFTTLTKLSSLKALSLVSLGLWGSLPSKISRLRSLEALNLSSNFIYGAIPQSIASIKSLRSLVLSENQLNGTVPDLSALSFLGELDLGSNILGPEFPSLGSQIVNLVLKNNTFRSDIPSKLESFEQLQRFDISDNKFIGAIPAALFSLPSIKQLNLAGNEFRGALLMNSQCSSTLEFVDLSHNFLTGDMPLCLSSNSSSRIVLYSWNCLFSGDLNYQHPNSFCYEKALAVKPPVQFEKKKTKHKVGLILSIVAAVIGGVGAFGFLVFAIFPKLRARKAENKALGTSVANKASVDARHASPATSLGVLGLPPYHIFSLEEIEEATNNFDRSNLMEEGTHGQIYKGFLRDGSMVVVRCLKIKQRHSLQSLMRNMEVTSKLRHQNLVSILGHCIDTDQDGAGANAARNIYLVFEYISNSSLRSHLTDRKKTEMLKWQQRMSIITGVTKGIQFLHTGVSPGMFGNNLKMEMILLDDSLAAKINSYHLPLLSMLGSEGPLNAAGLDGEKEDIYQMGVIILELVAGKPITYQSELDAQRIQMQRSLTASPSKLRELADTSIHSTFAYDSLRTTIEIAFNCLSKQSSERPSIEDVLWNLQYSAQVQEGWTPSSEIFSRQSYSSI